MTKCKLFKQPVDPERYSGLSKTAKTFEFWDDEVFLPWASPLELDDTESSILEKFQCAYGDELHFITGPVGLLTVIQGRCAVEANTLVNVTSDSFENLEKILAEFPKEEYYCSLYSVSKILSEDSIKNLKSEYYEDNGVIPLVHITPDILAKFSDTYRVRCAMTRKDSNKFYIPRVISPNPSLLEFYYYYDDKLYLQAVEEQKKKDSILLVPLNRLEYYTKKVGYILTTREKAEKDEDAVVDKLDELFVEWIPSNRIHLELRESKSGKYAIPMVDFSFIYKYDVDTPSDEEIMSAYMESTDAVDAMRNKYTTLKKNAYTPEEFVFQYINDYTVIDFWDYQFKVLNVEVEKHYTQMVNRWTDVCIKNPNVLQSLINRKVEEADQLSSQTNE